MLRNQKFSRSFLKPVAVIFGVLAVTSAIASRASFALANVPSNLYESARKLGELQSSFTSHDTLTGNTIEPNTTILFGMSLIALRLAIAFVAKRPHRLPAQAS